MSVKKDGKKWDLGIGNWELGIDDDESYTVAMGNCCKHAHSDRKIDF
jgi:hypothetical protein